MPPYDGLDNVGLRSPQRADPSLVHLRTGQRFMTLFTLVSFVSGESVTSTMRPGWPTRAMGAVTVTYRVVPVAPDRTRLEALMWLPPLGRVLACARRDALAWGDVVMMRKQRRTLVRRAGRDDGARQASARR
ncbi:hypothetical protein [Luteimicrobium subarcticum]|uniref:hypothetical protein n=1 Tax=Luteimicrobium subarcticum TaxID=620910 RepID=UPI000C23F051|nr:hypothetical protein [Luteimicrobium subarcticum]